MELQNYLYASILFLAGTGYFLNFSKNPGMTPATVICLFWGMATFSTYLKLQTNLLDFFLDVNGYGLAPYILPFATYTVTGLMLSEPFTHKIDLFSDESIRARLYQEADHYCKNLYFVLYLSLFFAGLRFISLGVSFGNLSGVRNAYVVASSGDSFYAWSTRLYFYSSFLTIYFLAALGVKYALSKINFKELWIVFLLYSLGGFAVAGRNFLATFIFFLGFPIIVLRGERVLHIFRKGSVYRHFLKLSIWAIFLFVLIGFMRDNNRTSERGTIGQYTEKLFYCSDGILFTDYLLNTSLISRSDNGFLPVNTLLRTNPPYASAIQYTPMAVWVQSILPDLFYDFGEDNAKYVWGFLCFLLQLITIRLYRTNHLWGCISATILTVAAAQTIMMNSFNTLYINFIFLILSFLVSRTRDKLSQNEPTKNRPGI